MLKALYDYAMRQGLILPAGYVKKTVRAYIMLTPEGRFYGLTPGGDETVPAPDIGSLANGTDKSNILLEKRSVVIPEEPSAKSSFFLEGLKAGGAAEPMLAVCAQALETPETVAAIRAELDRQKIKPSDRLSFQVDGRSILESPLVMTWWQDFRKQFRKEDADAASLCLITGEPIIPAVTTTPISGLHAVGGHARGDALICFDKPAFCSYGLKKAANAPVSEEAFAAVKAALDHLLEGAPVLAGMKFVHWYDRPIEDNDDPIIQCGDFGGYGAEEDEDEEPEAQPDREQEARSAVKRADQKVRSVRTGEIVPALADARYYILLLTGVGGRVMIRRFEQGSYAELHAHLEAWYHDLNLVNLGGRDPIKPCKLTVRLFRLLSYQKSERQPFKRLNKELAGVTPAVLTAILSGAPLPDSVAARALAYIRSRLLAQCDDADNKQLPVPDGWACQWLKVWLIRKHAGKEEQLMEKYNMEHPNPAYHCGGQMAVYAQIQREAMPDVNASIVQRYYASAIQTPAMVMGQLSHRATHHLDKMKNQWLAGEYQKLLAELNVAVGDAVPVALTLEDQSYFALGYYQMSAELNRRRAERIAEKQKKAEEKQNKSEAEERED